MSGIKLPGPGLAKARPQVADVSGNELMRRACCGAGLKYHEVVELCSDIPLRARTFQSWVGGEVELKVVQVYERLRKIAEAKQADHRRVG